MISCLHSLTSLRRGCMGLRPLVRFSTSSLSCSSGDSSRASPNKSVMFPGFEAVYVSPHIRQIRVACRWAVETRRPSH